MKKASVPFFFGFLMLSGMLSAQAILVLEPQFRIGGGGQSYSASFEGETRTYEGAGASTFAMLPGARLRLLSFKRLNDGSYFPLDAGLGAFYQFTKAGEFFDTLGADFGRYIDLKSLHAEGFLSYSFLKSGFGILSLDLGGFYDFSMGGETSTLYTSAPLSAAEFPGWYGIHAGLSFDMAFFGRGDYPALVGVGLNLNLDIGLNDLSVLEDESLSIWAFTVGFCLPLFV